MTMTTWLGGVKWLPNGDLALVWADAIVVQINASERTVMFALMTFSLEVRALTRAR
jgi:hypothetical protein